MIIPFIEVLTNQIPLQPLPASAGRIDKLKHEFYLRIDDFMGEDKAMGLVFICVMVVVLFFLKNLCRYLAQFFMASIRSGVVKDIRSKMYNKIMQLPLSYYSEARKGDLMTRLSSDITEIEWAIMNSMETLFIQLITFIAYLGALLYISPKLTLFVLIILPITGILVGGISKSLKRTSGKAQSKLGDLLSIIEETISGLRIVKAFNAEEASSRKFEENNKRYGILLTRQYRKRDLAAPLGEFLAVCIMIVVIWFGGKMVLSGEGLSASIFIGYLIMFSQLISPAKGFTTAFYNIQKGAASADRMAEVLDAKVTITEKPDAKSIDSFSNEIEYRDTSFKYQDNAVDFHGFELDGINIKIPKGKSVALIGQSGSGKSTIADILPRFYDCTSGDVLIDGISTRDLKIADLRGLMGVVTQESILFNDTVFNNISFGTDGATEEQVTEAAKVANAHDFIIAMEHSYQTNIGDSGSKLSGGQRQRLSIARAVLKNPPILILDEATSALDTESEKLVQDALFKLMENRTSIVIAHRLSTIQHSDEIIVLKEGAIIERGNHDELLGKNGEYKKLYDLQVFG